MKLRTLRTCAVAGYLLYSVFVGYSVHLFIWSINNGFPSGAIVTALYTLLTLPISVWALRRIWSGKLLSGNWEYEE